MISSHRSRAVSLALALALILTGCQTSGKQVAPQAPAQAPPSATPAPAAPTPARAPTPPPPAPSLPPTGPTLKISQIEVRDPHGEWKLAESGATLPVRNLTLRFRYQPNLAPAEFEKRVGPSFGKGMAVYSYPAAGVAEVTLPEAPPRLDFVTSAQGQLYLFFGEPPRLALLDLATGKESIVGEVPPSVAEAASSPDGRWAVLGAYSGPHGAESVWLVDLTTGRRQPLPFKADVSSGPFIWVEDRLLVPYFTSMQYWETAANKPLVKTSKGEFWGPLSPDGRYLAGFAHARGGEVSPATVVIYDVKTGTEEVYPDLAGSLVHSCWVELAMSWDATGTVLLIQDNLKAKSTQVLQLDRRTGQVTRTSQTTLPGPDPNQALLGPGPTGWRVATRDWGPLEGTSPKGKRFQWGEGFPVGWMPDGRLIVIRWPNAPLRAEPGGEC